MIFKNNSYKNRYIAHIFISKSVAKGKNLGQVSWLFPIFFFQKQYFADRLTNAFSHLLYTGKGKMKKKNLLPDQYVF